MAKLKEIFGDENRFFSLLVLLCLIVLVILGLVLGNKIINIQRSIVRIEDQIQLFTASEKQGDLTSSEDINKFSGELDISIGHLYGEVQNPKVVIIEFMDFECPYCAQAPQLINELIKANPGSVMVVSFDYPLPFHENAFGAALFANCASEQPGIEYKQLSDFLFENQAHIDPDSLLESAKTMNVDVDKLKVCMESTAAKDLINQSVEIGKSIGIKGTPAFIVTSSFSINENILRLDGDLVYLSQLVNSVKTLLNK